MKKVVLALTVAVLAAAPVFAQEDAAAGTDGSIEEAPVVDDPQTIEGVVAEGVDVGGASGATDGGGGSQDIAASDIVPSDSGMTVSAGSNEIIVMRTDAQYQILRGGVPVESLDILADQSAEGQTAKISLDGSVMHLTFDGRPETICQQNASNPDQFENCRVPEQS